MEVKIVYKGQNPFFRINGADYSTEAFRSYRPAPANISQFKRVGLDFYQMIVSGRKNTLHIYSSLFGEIWTGPNEYNFSRFDRQMEMFRKFAPDSYYSVLIQIDTPEWWVESHPGHVDSYWFLGQSTVDEEWKKDASEYLRAFIDYAEEKYGDVIFSYSIAAGRCNEWFCNDFGAETPQKLAAYRAYLDDPEAKIPELEDYSAEESCYRSPDSNELKYLQFSCGLHADMICYFAAEAQKSLCHKKPFCMFGWYTHMSPKNQNLWLTNGYEKILESPDIDMVYSPAPYQHNRDIDGVSSYQLPLDSLKLHGKLYLHEMDHRSELAAYPLENGVVLGQRIDNFSDFKNVLRREISNVVAHGGSMWWFDFFGGYYAAPNYEQELCDEFKAYNEIIERPNDDVSEVAVFCDPMSFLYCKENVDLHQTMVRYNLDSIIRSGAPFRFYNLNDLDKIDIDRFKVFIFLNAIDPPNREFIKERLADKYKVFIGAAGYSYGGKLDTAGIEDLTGIKVSEFKTDRVHTVSYSGHEFGFEDVISPMFRVEDDRAEILGEYMDGGVAVARKGKSFYCAVGNIPYEFFLDVNRAAGVHIYNDEGGAIAVTSDMISCYGKREENTLRLPFDCTLTDLYTGDVIRTENGVAKYTDKVFETRVFKITK